MKKLIIAAALLVAAAGPGEAQTFVPSATIFFYRVLCDNVPPVVMAQAEADLQRASPREQEQAAKQVADAIEDMGGAKAWCAFETPVIDAYAASQQ